MAFCFNFRRYLWCGGLNVNTLLSHLPHRFSHLNSWSSVELSGLGRGCGLAEGSVSLGWALDFQKPCVTSNEFPVFRLWFKRWSLNFLVLLPRLPAATLTLHDGSELLFLRNHKPKEIFSSVNCLGSWRFISATEKWLTRHLWFRPEMVPWLGALASSWGPVFHSQMMTHNYL